MSEQFLSTERVAMFADRVGTATDYSTVVVAGTATAPKQGITYREMKRGESVVQCEFPRV